MDVPDRILALPISGVAILALGLLVLVLGAVILLQRRSEQRLRSVLDRLQPTQLTDLLTVSSSQGTILQIAAGVSGILTKVLGCDRILFLRKQRAFLDLNYHQGLGHFDRAGVRLRLTPELMAHFRETFAPRRVNLYSDLMPKRFLDLLRAQGLDTYIPVYWRENLYGVYFLRSRFKRQHPLFATLAPGLAHALAAAYHVKWHEAKLERQGSHPTVESPDTAAGTGQPERRILKLVRHRTTETLVPNLVASLRDELSSGRLLFAYEPRSKSDEPHVIGPEPGHEFAGPSRLELSRLTAALPVGEACRIESLAPTDETVRRLLGRLRERGMDYVAAVQLTNNRSGLLALATRADLTDVVQTMTSLVEASRDLIENAESFEQMEELSYTDPVTGLANIRYFRKRLDEEIDRARRYSRSLGLIIFDIDDFKNFNDRYGHPSGDAILRRVGHILRASIRAIDILTRYGGDEFCIIMPESDQSTCLRFMERLNRKIAATRFHLPEHHREITCNISLGGAVFPDHADNADRLLFCADMALLESKARGRDTYRIYSETTPLNSPD